MSRSFEHSTCIAPREPMSPQTRWIFALLMAELDVAGVCVSTPSAGDPPSVTMRIGTMARAHRESARLLEARLVAVGVTKPGELAAPIPNARVLDGSVLDRLQVLHATMIALASAYQNALRDPGLQESVRWSIATRLLPETKSHLMALDELIERHER